MLIPASEEVVRPQLAALRQRLEQLDHREGRDYQTTIRYTSPGDREAVLQDGAALLALSPAVILTASDVPVLAMHQLTTSVPVVFAAFSDPVAYGIAQGFAHPGGNMTGIVVTSNDAIVGKQLALLKEIAPTIHGVAAVFQAGDAAIEHVTAYADELRLAVRVYSVARKDEVISVVVGNTDQRDAFFFGSSPIFNTMREEIVALVAKTGRPAMYANNKQIVRAGGLMSYGVSIENNYRIAAEYIAKILDGAAPGDLPIQQPAIYELALNLKTAKAMGLAIPPTLLARVDEAIE